MKILEHNNNYFSHILPAVTTISRAFGVNFFEKISSMEALDD